MTFENVVFESQFKNVFNSRQIQAPFLRYSIFCILDHSTNFGNCDIMMSTSTREKVCFYIKLLNQKSHLVMKPGQLIINNISGRFLHNLEEWIPF